MEVPETFNMDEFRIQIQDDGVNVPGDQNIELDQCRQISANSGQSSQPDCPKQNSDDGTEENSQGGESSTPFLELEMEKTPNKSYSWTIGSYWENMTYSAKAAALVTFVFSVILFWLVIISVVIYNNKSELESNEEMELKIVEERLYAKTCPYNRPCPEMKHARFCDKTCPSWKVLRNPTDAKLLQTLSLSPKFTQVLVSSTGLAPLSRATGLYGFTGEFTGTPVFQNILTGLYLYFIKKGGVTYWQVGPSYKTTRAVIDAVSSSKVPEIGLQENAPKKVLNEHNEYQTDETITIKGYSEIAEIDCECLLLRVSFEEYHPKHFPIIDLDGDFRKDDELRQQLGLPAPVYYDKKTGYIVYSTQPLGQVWFVSHREKLNIYNKPLARAITPSCPEDGKSQDWELLMINTTSPGNNEYYGKEETFQMECVLKENL